MFEVGKFYRLHLWRGNQATELWNCRVVAVEMPVVEFDHKGDQMIVNVSSKAFVMAEPEAEAN